MIYVKIHDTDNGNILAMCDEELIGRVFKEGKTELDMPRYAGFYKGELVSEKDAEMAAKDIGFYSANVVGERSVKVMMDINACRAEDIRRIEGIPFIHIYKML